jgi:hypothetical protein
VNGGKYNADKRYNHQYNVQQAQHHFAGVAVDLEKSECAD